MGRRKMLGRPMSILDGQIASVASANDFSVVTRNMDAFEACGVTLFNPFEGTKGK